jgi:flagellar biosynthetic protein FliQ
MNPEIAIDVFKTTILFALYVASPFLVCALVVGLATSLFQSITSLQEATLTFAPKLIAFTAMVILLAPWLLRSLSEFTITVLSRMSSLAH